MKTRRQVGAIAYRESDMDGVRILLVTSRETGRWVVPKGWPMKSKRPHKAAAQEAYEEAGVQGRVRKKASGSYRYPKLLGNGDIVPCRVRLFALRVKEEMASWPEAAERRRCWFSPEEAASAVNEPDLAQALRDFAGGLRKAGPAVEPPPSPAGVPDRTRSVVS